MQGGHTNMRGWWQAVWGQMPDTQQKKDQFHTATIIDLRIDEFWRAGAAKAVMWALLHDDLLEGSIRQMAFAREFKLTGDEMAAD